MFFVPKPSIGDAFYFKFIKLTLIYRYRIFHLKLSISFKMLNPVLFLETTIEISAISTTISRFDADKWGILFWW